jgi:hypothetical protein
MFQCPVKVSVFHAEQNIIFVIEYEIPKFCFSRFYLQKFSKCNIGQHLNHKDRNGRVKLLICAEKIKGVSQWKFVDGNMQMFSIIEIIMHVRLS